MTSSPTIATPVADVIKCYPALAQEYALDLRALILKTAAQDARIGALTETLKWREPAYLTEVTKSGTTLRFDWKEKRPHKMGLFVNCKTTLIQSFQDMFADELSFEGTRAIWLNLNEPLPRDILAICIGKTLTYHLDK
ncbi:MAG: DUF1801 domain-containing protein [Hellea sp.]